MRMVFCKKLNKELLGLEKAPFRGELGQKIYDHISAEAWDMWSKDMQIKVVNEYRLNLADSADYKRLVEQMQRFLNLVEGQVVEVENASRGRS